MTKSEIRESWALFKIRATIYAIFALIWLRKFACGIERLGDSLSQWLYRGQLRLEDSLPKPPPPPHPIWRSDGQVHNRNVLPFPRNMAMASLELANRQGHATYDKLDEGQQQLIEAIMSGAFFYEDLAVMKMEEAFKASKAALEANIYKSEAPKKKQSRKRKAKTVKVVRKLKAKKKGSRK